MSVATSTGSASWSAVAPTGSPPVWSNLGPLTTVFTGPPSCATRQAIFSEILDGQNLIAVQCDSISNSVGIGSIGNETAFSMLAQEVYGCAPSSSALFSIYSAQFASSQDIDTPYTTEYYSPGISCPSGYSTATSFTLAASQIPSITTKAIATVTGTHIVCCPSGYAAYDTDYGYCSSTASAATTITNLCFNSCTMGETCSTPSPFTYNPAAQPTVTVEAGIEAVYMVHQQSDVPSATAATATKTGGARTERVGFGAMVSMAMLAVFAVGIGSL